MSTQSRRIVMIGGAAALVAGAIVSPVLFPQAFADEPQHKVVQTIDQLFPAPFDPSKLKKFKFTIDDDVSVQPQRTRTVSKIAFGHRTTVDIVTTATGTYSSDAIASPYVRYPGIDVEPKTGWPCQCEDGYAVSTYTSPYGTWTSTRINSGSFSYLTSEFKPAKRPPR